MPSLELLTVVHTRGVDGTADVAAALGVDEAQAEQQLREAERAGLVVKEHGDSVRIPIDDARGRLRLTAAGHVKKQTLEDERAA
jgi:DNA-binding MarR family transcriptional regulator